MCRFGSSKNGLRLLDGPELAAHPYPAGTDGRGDGVAGRADGAARLHLRGLDLAATLPLAERRRARVPRQAGRADPLPDPGMPAGSPGDGPRWRPGEYGGCTRKTWSRGGVSGLAPPGGVLNTRRWRRRRRPSIPQTLCGRFVGVAMVRTRREARSRSLPGVCKTGRKAAHSRRGPMSPAETGHPDTASKSTRLQPARPRCNSRLHLSPTATQTPRPFYGYSPSISISVSGNPL